MKTRFLLFSLLAIALFATIFPAQERGGKEAGAFQAAAGQDPNIKPSSSEVNSRSFYVEPPANKAKPGEKKRDLVCGVRVDNKTTWKVKIYVDGSYEGTVGPWGDIYTVLVCGQSKVYARADFEDKTYLAWGPQDFKIKDGKDYEWVLPEPQKAGEAKK